MSDNQTTNAQHPGARLKQELKARGITQRSAAAKIGMQPSHMSEIVKGRRNVTKGIAAKLEDLLKIPAAEWLRLQTEYDYQCNKAGQKDDSELEADRLIHDYDHVYDMKIIFRNANLSSAPATERLAFCKESLHFGSPAVQERAMQGYLHKSDKTGLDVRMISTWSVLAIYEAGRAAAPEGTFAVEKCDELAAKLEAIFTDNHNTLNRVARLLSDYGIKFCVVPKVPHASIDGFSFYADDIPCIVITKRFDRIDNLAFAVLHELGHLKMHLEPGDIGKVTVVDPDQEKPDRKEIEANAFAADALMPDALWSTLPAMKMYPADIQRQVTSWAKANGKNKWIALGRISHDLNVYAFKTDDSRKIM